MNRAQRIRAAEQRLIEREEGLRRRLEQLVGRGRQAVTSSRGRWPALGAAVALGAAALWWLARHRAARSPALARGPGAAALNGRPSATRARWVHLLGAAWPWVLPRWRTRLGPAGAAAVTSIGLPLLEQWLAPSPESATLGTVPYLDLGRYGGTWFEIARLPSRHERFCASQPTATYGLHRGRLHIENRCCDATGREHVARGEGRVVPGSGNARLQVSLAPAWLRFLPMAWDHYQVLHVDRDYRHALVGHPDRRHLWLLAREPQIDPVDETMLVELAAVQGFPVERLVFARDRARHRAVDPQAGPGADRPADR